MKGGINEIKITETKKRNLLKKSNLCVNFATIVDISNNSDEIKIEKVFQNFFKMGKRIKKNDWIFSKEKMEKLELEWKINYFLIIINIKLVKKL